jgi:long-chain acyl-CoA synthetase
MYPGAHAVARAGEPVQIMGRSGEVLTYADFEARANRLAHYFRSRGLKRLDHYSVFMENHPRFIECCAAGERSGLYFTNVNCYLTAAELAYILNNSESKLLITSRSRLAVAREAMREAPRIEVCLLVDATGDGDGILNLDEATAPFPSTPIADEVLGGSMLYSSGTTGNPKGILRALPEQPPSQMLPVGWAFWKHWRIRERTTYLIPAPLYHSAPWTAASLAVRDGGTLIVMEKFDAEEALRLIERHRVTHAQFVPTMFSRMLKLPEDARRRYDLSSLEVVLHGAAPCPVSVKRAMIEWFGPIVHEYYGATEGMGLTICDSQEWLTHPGTVGKAVFGEPHILDDEMNELPAGGVGKIWFKCPNRVKYFHDEAKSAAANSPDGTMSTVGDIGYLDADGFLYLTDRAAFMIISGGVNIYPQECENLLATHPKVADAAVFGVPNEEMGEEVKAVVQPAPGVEAGAELEAELIAFCRERLAHLKCPRSIDFEANFPRLPTGKLYKQPLRDRYWQGHRSRIL